MDAVAAAEVQKAQASTACPNPLIALNELLGSDAAGPLPAAAQRYRDAVLALMRALAADGATPFLLVPRRFTTTGTEDWWRQVGQVGWLVPEAYTPATSLWSIGDPVPDQPRDPRGLPRVGRPPDRARHPAPSRIGLMLGFQSGDSVRRPRRPAADRRPGSRSSSSSQQAGLAVARELGALDACGRGGGGRSRRRAAPTPTSRRRPAPTCGRATRRSATPRRWPIPAASIPTSTAGAVDLARRAAVPLHRRLVHDGRADRADRRRRHQRGRAHGAARAQPRAHADDGRPDGAAARRAQRDRRRSSTASAGSTCSSCRSRARRPPSRATPSAISCSRPRSRAGCASRRSRAPT